MSRQLGFIANTLTSRADECFAALKQKPLKSELPEATTLIGDSTVDVMNVLSGAVMVDSMRYTPRPVIQSYAVYTPFLQQLNLSFMESARSPELMLMDMHAIDNRLPTMDDAPLYPWLLKNYRPEAIISNFLLLRKNSDGSSPPLQELISEQLSSFDTPLYLAQWNDSPLMIQVEVETTLPGKLAGIFYQKPPLTWTLSFDGKTIVKRFVPNIARGGVLINPILLDVGDLMGYYTGSWHRLDLLRINQSQYARLFYKDKIKVRIYKVRC